VPIDRDLTVTYTSAGCEQPLGYRPDEMVGRHALDLIRTEDHERSLADLTDLLVKPDEGVPVVIGINHRNGSTVFVEVGAQVLLDDPQIAAIVVRLRPYDDQKLLESYLEALATSVPVEQTLLPLVGPIKAQHLTSEVAAYDWDPITQRFGLDRAHRATDALAGAADADDRPDREPPPWVTAILTEQPVIVTSMTCSRSPIGPRSLPLGLGSCWVYPVPVPPDTTYPRGLVIWLEAPGGPMIGHASALEPRSGWRRSGSSARHSEQLLLHAALHDTLTGIPNRSHFFGELQRIEHPDPDDDRGHCAVLFADLDGFKEINDTYGHGVGDQVLAVIARRLEAAIRPGDVVARVGGDEFAVLCTDLDADSEATAVAERLIEVVSQPIAVGEITARVGLSIGVAFHDPAAEVEGRLVDAADHALYQAKQIDMSKASPRDFRQLQYLHSRILVRR
jgi:diguanylate cyclase (GGDEF)-like protein/PAS domain S-box-containing protein